MALSHVMPRLPLPCPARANACFCSRFPACMQRPNRYFYLLLTGLFCTPAYGHSDPNILFGQAMEYKKEQNYREVICTLTLLLKETPDLPRAMLELANAYVKTNQPKKALPLLEALMQRDDVPIPVRRNIERLLQEASGKHQPFRATLKLGSGYNSNVVLTESLSGIAPARKGDWYSFTDLHLNKDATLHEKAGINISGGITHLNYFSLSDYDLTVAYANIQPVFRLRPSIYFIPRMATSHYIQGGNPLLRLYEGGMGLRASYGRMTYSLKTELGSADCVDTASCAWTDTEIATAETGITRRFNDHYAATASYRLQRYDYKQNMYDYTSHTARLAQHIMFTPATSATLDYGLEHQEARNGQGIVHHANAILRYALSDSLFLNGEYMYFRTDGGVWRYDYAQHDSLVSISYTW